MFKKLKTRKGKLKRSIKEEISKESPNVTKILEAVDRYEKNNLDTIEKLKKKKRSEIKKINGALRQTIKAHGPITKELIGSASKRIYGAMILNPNDKAYQIEKKLSIKSIIIGIVLGIIATLCVINIF